MFMPNMPTLFNQARQKGTLGSPVKLFQIMSGSGTAIPGFFKEFLVLRQQSWDLSPGVFIVVVTVASLHHFSQHHKGLSQIHNNIFPPRGTLLNTERYFLFVPSYVLLFQQRLSERH